MDRLPAPLVTPSSPVCGSWSKLDLIRHARAEEAFSLSSFPRPSFRGLLQEKAMLGSSKNASALASQGESEVWGGGKDSTLEGFVVIQFRCGFVAWQTLKSPGEIFPWEFSSIQTVTNPKRLGGCSTGPRPPWLVCSPRRAWARAEPGCFFLPLTGFHFDLGPSSPK